MMQPNYLLGCLFRVTFLLHLLDLGLLSTPLILAGACVGVALGVALGGIERLSRFFWR